MSTEIAEQANEPGAVAAPAVDPVSSALAEVTTTNVKITELAAKGRELAERYKGVVADVRTVKGYDQIAGIRKELREEVRYPMQELKKDGSKMLGTMQRQFNARAEQLIAEAEEHEKPFHDLLVAEDGRKAREREEREQAEQRRKEGHTQAIAAITRMALDAVGYDIPELERSLESAQGVIVDEGYEEFQGQAQQAKDEAVRQINGMLVAARADAAEREELEEIRRRQAAFAQQQEEQRIAAEAREQEERQRREASDAENARLRQQVADMEAERERQRVAHEQAVRERSEAIERRIELLRQIPSAMRNPEPDFQNNLTSEARREVRSHVAGATMTVDLYGDRLQEAVALQTQVLTDLNELIAEAVEREIEEERQRLEREEQERRDKRAAQVQELLDQMRALGNTAALAVQDGSADVEQLRSCMQELETTSCGNTFFDDRADEALQIRDTAIEQVRAAIEATIERDRLRAEEAERQRQEQRRLAAQMQADQMMRDNAILLFPAARALVEFIERHVPPPEGREGELSRLTDDVRNILRRVPNA